MMTQNEKEALLTAIKLSGGQKALAKKLGIKQQSISMWLKNGIPLKRVLHVEKLVNRRITRYQLKPDFYPLEP